MVRKIKVRTALNIHKYRDKWFLDDYSVNPYSGCSFNCVYCYIRGWRRKSIETPISAKINVPEILERQLKTRANKDKYGIIALSTSTEPYMKMEEKFQLTRKTLEVISRYRFPVHILTKSILVLRDIDLLKEIDRNAILPEDLRILKRGVIVTFSISTLDESLSSIVEPGAPAPLKRMEAMKMCKKEGLLTGIAFIPVLPFLSDSEEKLNEMIKTARDYGADYVFVGALTLYGDKPSDCKTLYYKFLERQYPNLVLKYRNLFGTGFQPSGDYLRVLKETARRICGRYEIKMNIL